VLMPAHDSGGLLDGELIAVSWGSERLRNRLQNEGLNGDIFLGCGNASFCAICILKCIILPRQARDKHRENSIILPRQARDKHRETQKRTRFCRNIVGFVIGILVVVQTGSFVLGLLGMLHVLLSFTLAYFVYGVLLGFVWFPFLNLLGLFVILGERKRSC
jgi:hypothetical protein